MSLTQQCQVQKELWILKPSWVVNFLKSGSKPFELDYLHPISAKFFDEDAQKRIAGLDDTFYDSSEKSEAVPTNVNAGEINSTFACFKTYSKERWKENDHLIKVFEDLEEIYNILGDEFRCLAYKVDPSIVILI